MHQGVRLAVTFGGRRGSVGGKHLAYSIPPHVAKVYRIGARQGEATVPVRCDV